MGYLKAVCVGAGMLALPRDATEARPAFALAVEVLGCQMPHSRRLNVILFMMGRHAVCPACWHAC